MKSNDNVKELSLEELENVSGGTPDSEGSVNDILFPCDKCSARFSTYEDLLFHKEHAHPCRYKNNGPGTTIYV